MDLERAVARLDPPPGVLLAVDDGSDDGTEAALRRTDFQVLVHEQNRGLGSARNTLWRRAEALGVGAVAFLDADVLPPADYLARVCAHLKPGVAGVGGRNLDLDPASWIDAWRGRFWAQSLGESLTTEAHMLIGACATYTIEALKDVGGFNPRFRTHAEDVDIGRRLRAQGKRLLYDPAIVVSHERADSPVDLLVGCYRNCRDGMRATQGTPGAPPSGRRLVYGMAKKTLHAPAAALIKRRSGREAALGAIACTVGLLGYVVGWAVPDPRSR